MPFRFFAMVVGLSLFAVAGAASGFASGASAQSITVNGEEQLAEGDDTITKSDPGDHGINIPPTVDGAVIEIDGDAHIVTEGDHLHGVFSEGEDTEVTVEGEILTRNPHSRGINVLEEGAVITVTEAGTIMTSGEESLGISVEGGGANIMMAGTIRTEGRGGEGILSSGPADSPGDRIVVTGMIRTMRAEAEGISAKGPDVNIMVGGTVETAGDRAEGIDSTGPDARITVNEGGLIQTGGGDSPGIAARGPNARIMMAGTIVTTGHGSRGILASGGNADIVVSGTIRTTGSSFRPLPVRFPNHFVFSHGIHAARGGETITLSGEIHVTGEETSAIFGRGGQTLRLLRGWRITGPVTLEDGAENRLELDTYGTGASRTFYIRHLREAVRIAGMRPMVSDLDEGTIAVLDPSASAMQRVAMANLTRAVHGAVHERRAAARPVPAGAESGGMFGDRRAWGRVIGGDFERDADGAALGWDGRVYGVIAGVEGSLRNGIRVGVLGGYARGETATGTASVDVDTSTGMLGIYGETGGDIKGGWTWTLTGALVGGYNNYDATRLVDDDLAGRLQARGSRKGLFASPSVGVKFALPVGDEYEIRPSLRVDGLYARHDSYTESGAGASNVTYDSRKSLSADGRAQLGLAFLFGQSTELEMRVGATTRLHAGDEVTARLVSGGAPVTYDVPGNDNVHGGFVGGLLTWALRDRFSLVAGGEYAVSTGGERALRGHLKLAVSF